MPTSPVHLAQQCSCFEGPHEVVGGLGEGRRWPWLSLSDTTASHTGLFGLLLSICLHLSALLGVETIFPICVC